MGTPSACLLLPGHMCDARLWLWATLPHPAIHADLTRDDRIGAMAARVLADAPPRFVAAGLSMGGIVALEIARTAPDRLAGLVLIDTNAGADLPERAAARLAHQGRVLGGALREIVGEEMKPAYLAAENRERRDILDLVMAMAEDLGPDVFVRQSEAIRTRPDARGALIGIMCPTLIMCGADDRLCPPEWHRDMAAAIRGAELHVIDGSGHLPPLEQPERFSHFLGAWFDALPSKG